MKIIIADSLPDSAAALLREQGWTVDARAGRPAPELLDDIADADGLIVRSATKVTKALISAAPQLRIIARAGTGVDNVDLGAAEENGILVVNAPGANSISVAEHTCALLLALSRHIATADNQMKRGLWEKKSLRGAELRGKTLGILGLGRIGCEVARRATAFEMTVVAYDPFISTQLAGDLAVELLSLDELRTRSDYVTLHIPSTAATVQLIDRAWLTQCKPGVRIVNTARGDLIDEVALLEGLTSNQVAGAALDVFQVEPPMNEELIGHPNVVATPHIAASTKEAQELVGVETATCVRDFLKSGMVRNAVNFPTVSPEESKQLQPYMVLAERLGSLLGQLTDDRVEGVGVRYYGELSEKKHDMLVGAVLVGLFKQVLSSTVTLVNARSTADQRGVEVVESQSSRSRDFTSLISVKLYTNAGERWAEGAVFAPNEPRLVLLDGVPIESTLQGTLIIVKNSDQPGVIGEVGTVLGKHDVNIATFALGRGPSGAVGVVNVESNDESGQLKDQVIEELQEIPAVSDTRTVRF
tara:strand:+ start:8782 stop:10368 length:1587 start_codon:yes stop_codon:yes gene_type:complete